jgi:carbonic anhydrase/acetyltransferase-like protein (isoleucine patch superfamily)
MQLSSVISCLALSTVLAHSAVSAVLQKWQYSNQPPFKAEFVTLRGLQNERSDTMLYFKRPDGKIRALKLKYFSPENQDYARKQAAKNVKRWKEPAADTYLVNVEVYNDGTPINVLTTKHFRLVYGNDTNGTGKIAFEKDFQVNLTNYFEKLWYHLASRGVPMPYWNTNIKYKVNVYMTGTGLPKHKSGWAFGAKSIMIHPNAMLEGSSVIPHEFGHVLQYYSGGFRNNSKVGWFWECIANYTAHQFIPSHVPGLRQHAQQSHFDLSSFMARYTKWAFVQYMTEHPDFDWGYIYTLWPKCKMDPKRNSALETPFQTLMRVGVENGIYSGDGVKDFGDTIAEHAAHNVHWDYALQNLYSESVPNNDRTRTPLEPVPDRPGFYRPPAERVPRQYGYNIIPLYPEKDAGEIAVQFAGIQNKTDYADWRAIIVAMDKNGDVRYSDTWNTGIGRMKIKNGDHEFHLAVTATPYKYQHLEYRTSFPYEVSFKGCKPMTRPYDHPRMPYEVVCTAHTNGGGFVAETASVAPTVFVGPDALVLDTAEVTGDARIEGNAVVNGKARVSGSVIVSDYARITDNAEVGGNARVRGYAIVSGNARLSGNAKIMEHAVVSGSAVIQSNAIVRGYVTLSGGRQGGKMVSGNAVLFDNANLSVAGVSKGVFPYWIGKKEASDAADIGGCYLEWNFTTPEGGIARDEALSNDGILRNGAAMILDGSNSVLKLNGKDQYVLAGKDLADMQDMTMTFRVYWEGGKPGQRLVTFDGGQDAYLYITPASSGGKLACAIKNGTNTQFVAARTPLPKNTWVTLQLVLNGDAASLYLDGKQVGHKTGFTLNPEDLHARAVYFGCDGNQQHCFKGKLESVSVHREARDI